MGCVPHLSHHTMASKKGAMYDYQKLFILQKAGFRKWRSQSWSGKQSHKRAYDSEKIKIRVVSRVVNMTELESEEPECFRFLLTPLITLLLTIWWKPDCWSWKQKQKDKPITMHIPTLCDWEFSSCPCDLSCDSQHLVRKWQSCKQNQNAAFTRS